MSDKNNDSCLKCKRRVEYVAALEGRSCSVPVEMTDMARQSSEKTKADDQFLRDHPDMPAAEIAKQLGRSPASVYTRRCALGITGKNRRDLIRQRHAEMKSVQARKTVAHGTGHDTLPATPAELTPTRELVMININGFEEIYERLKRSAQENFRTPELQALFFIHQGLKAESGGRDQRREADGTS
ncbi:MAG: hypothetical protein MUC33_01165 [Desulfobacterales bacterium]|jgi:hypothetical protein|nr:hypothetical protein [Desulfobacterales bacterium]MCU0601252.1 hypothetical protein [Desulfobacterales bacterium]